MAKTLEQLKKERGFQEVNNISANKRGQSAPAAPKRKTIEDLKKERGYVEPEIDYWKEQPIRTAAKNINTGINALSRGVVGVTDATIGNLGIKPVDNFVQRHKDYFAKEDAEMAKINKGHEIIGSVAQGAGQAISTLPFALLNPAAATGVGSAGMTTAGGTQLVANAAKLANPSTLNAARTVALNLKSNPSLYTSMVTSVGNQYLQGLNQGATREQAIKSAVIGGVPSALIEVSGGLENITNIFANRTKGLMGKALQSALEEGLEEIVQYPVENMGQKIAFDKNMPYFSMQDQAIVNPKEMAQAGFVGATVGGLFGGGAAGINSALNSRNSKVIDKEYKNTINSLPDDSPILSRVKDLQDNNVNIDNDTKLWVINSAIQQQGNFESETDKLIQTEGQKETIFLNENKANEQTLEEGKTFGKSQNNGSTNVNPILSVFNIKNIKNPKEVKQNVYNFYKNTIISDSNTSKPIANKSSGMNVEVSHATINQTFQADDKYMKNQDNEIKVAAMANVVDLIQNGNFEVVNETDTPSSKVKYAEIKGTVNVNGVPYDIIMDVRRTDNGKKLFVHSLSTNNQQVINNSVNKKNGVIYSQASEKVRVGNPLVYSTLDKIGKAINTKIEFVETIYDPTGTRGEYANGQFDYSTNTLQIALDSSNPFMVVAKHEITHILQKESPKLYHEYKDHVLNSMKANGTYDREYNKTSTLYEAYGLEIDKNGIEDELVADATEQFLTDEAAINDLAANNPTLGQKILDILRQFISKIENAIGKTTDWMNTEQLRKAEELWVKALSDVANNNEQKANQSVEENNHYKYETKYSIRTKEPPKKTIKAYKLLRIDRKTGKLYPSFVGATEETIIGTWLDADEGELVTDSKTGTQKVKSKLGNLAYRPGWHLGDIPLATHIGVKGASGEIEYMNPNHVWVECDVAADISYQGEANANGINQKTSKFNRAKADLKKLPVDGFYRYKTNPNMTGEWIITGAMKINRVLSDEEAFKIVRDAGFEPLPRKQNDKKYSLKENVRPEEVAETAEKRFGVQVYDIERASYLTVNGKFLAYGTDINKMFNIPEDMPQDAGVTEFMSQGNIKLYNRGINITAKPNTKQMKAIRKFMDSIKDTDASNMFVDYSSPVGYTIGGTVYHVNASIDKVIADIENFFETGEIADYVPRKRVLYSLKNEVFYTPNKVEVIKNPTDKQIEQLRADFKKEYPELAKIGEPPTRKTYDIDGNVYYWKSTDGMHHDVEYWIDKKYNTKTEQNKFFDIKYNNKKFSLKAPAEETKDLIAVHNLDEDNLKGIIELGGFPVPSIAITKAEQGHLSFGDISVIFTKDTIDPKFDKRNKVFGSDVYSKRFPDINYKLDSNVIKKIKDKLHSLTDEKYRKTFSLSLDEVNISNKLKSSRANGDFVKGYADEPLLKIAFLKDKGIAFKPVLREKTFGKWETPLLEKIKKHLGDKEAAISFRNLEDTMKLEPDIRHIINEFYQSKISDKALLEIFTHKEPMGFGVLDDLLGQVSKYAKEGAEKEIDYYKTIEKLDKVTPKRSYGDWLTELSKGIIERKGVRNDKELFTASGNRRSFEQLNEEYVLDTIVKLMKGDVRGGEGFMYGLGNVRAGITKEFKSIKDIKQDKDKLVPPEKFKEIRDKANEEYNKLSSQFSKYHRHISGFSSAFDSSMFETAKKGRLLPAAFKEELKKDGYEVDDIPDFMINNVLDFLKSLKDMPTEYFEAKPQRAVYLDEIAAVVAPKRINKELLQNLKDNNVKVIKYDEKVEGDRLKKINSVENVKFQLKDNRNSNDVERLKKINERLKEQFKLTKGIKLDESAVKKLARTILKDYSSKYSKTELETKLYRLYTDYINDNIEFEDMQASITEIAGNIIDNASVLNDEMYKQYNDLRNTLRNTAISIGDKYKGDFKVVGGYDKFRKSNFGRINLTDDGMDIDSLYQELAEMYPELFLKDITNSADQLLLVSDVLDKLVPIYENPYNRDLNEAVEYLALEIFDSTTGIPEAKPTFADRKKTEKEKAVASEREKAKAKIAELKAKNADDIAWLKYQNKEKLKQVLDKEKTKRDEAVAKVRKQYKDQAYVTWWKNKLKENDIKSHYQEMIKEIRADRDEKLEKQAAKYKERISGIYEDRKVRQAKDSIGRKAKRLDLLLRKPTQKKHIPKALDKTIAELLSILDFATDKQKENTVLRLRDLKAEYEKIAKVSDEDGLSTTADEHITESLELLHGKRISEMNLDELELLRDIVSYFENMVKTYNKAFVNGKWVDVREKSESIMKELGTDKPVNESAYGMIQNFKNMMNWGMVTPQMYFERMGNAFTELWDDFRDALDTKIKNTKIAQDYMSNLLKNSRDKIKEWTGEKAEVKTIVLDNGKNIEMTQAQLMSFYLLMKREQARGHIFGLGIKNAPIVHTEKGIKKIKKQFEPVKITLNDAARMIGMLTKEQKKIADGIGVFMNTYSKQWVNEATLKNYGYELAKEENYFPIKSDRDFLKSDFDNTNLDPTFTSMGFLKATVKGAGNAIVIEDVFDVFTEHADKAATYNAFLGITENTKKITNFRTQEDSVKQAMNKKYGNQAFSYLKKFMVDLQGGIRLGESDNPLIKMSNTLIRNTKRSMLGLNLRTVVQQPTAIIRASAIIDVKYLIQGTAMKSDKAEMLEHSPIALWKSWGYFNLDTGRTMRDIILDSTPKLDKQYALIQKADDLTWTKIWNAVKLEVEEVNSGLKVGSKEYFEAVSARFTEIIDKTQVVDTVMHRSALMRDKDSLAKLSTSFMSEPTKAYNLLLNAAEKYKNDKSEANKKELIRTISAWAATTLVNTLVVTLVDMWRRKEDDKESMANKYLDNLLNDVTGYVPLVRDIYSIVQGYSVKRMEYYGFERVFRAMQRTGNYLDEISEGKKHKYSLPLISKDWLEGVAYMFGIGAANVTREIEAALRNYIRWTDDDGFINMLYESMFKK